MTSTSAAVSKDSGGDREAQSYSATRTTNFP
jgi:hypothetical protein